VAAYDATLTSKEQKQAPFIGAANNESCYYTESVVAAENSWNSLSLSERSIHVLVCGCRFFVSQASLIYE
jgi:hypothetical protein